MKLLFAFFLFLSQGHAAEIAFIEHLDANGEPTVLESGGRFYHAALSIGDQWLQAHPYRGVEITSLNEIEKMGCVAMTVTVPDEMVNRALISQNLGRPFDFDFQWTDGAHYCAEIVGKALGIPPEPMHFDPKLWPAKYAKLNGLPGLSPDDIARYFLSRGSSKKEFRCR